jgi:predicted LPLAT superfamily acyltransferase
MMDQHPFAGYFATTATLQRWAPFPRAGRVQRALSRLVAAPLLSQRVAALQCCFEVLLGETSAAARELVYDWFFYKQLERGSWAGTAGGRDGSVLLDARRVGAYLDQCSRGIVVATIHMGDYLEGLRQLRLACVVERRVFVIGRREWSEAQQRVFDRIYGADTELTVLRRGNRSAATAIRELRRGAIVVVLYDLPARYGRTAAVDFFGRAANFVRGPAELAVAGGADVLPLFCHYDDDGAAIAQIMPVIPALAVGGGERAARVVIVAQRLCALAEAQIRRHPSQWAHWSLVNELIDADAGLTSLR